MEPNEDPWAPTLIDETDWPDDIKRAAKILLKVVPSRNFSKQNAHNRKSALEAAAGQKYIPQYVHDAYSKMVSVEFTSGHLRGYVDAQRERAPQRTQSRAPSPVAIRRTFN